MTVACHLSQQLRKVPFNQKSRLFAMASRVFSLDGIFPAIPTPFDQNEEVDFNALKNNLALWEKIPFKGYLFGGSFSEVAALSLAERLAIVKEARKLISKDKLIIGGATCESTKATCEMSEALAKEGADCVLVLLPFYYRTKIDDEAILDHYTTVANRSPIPVVIYNNPLVTGIDISISVYSKLSLHPNIAGVKDGDVQKISGIKLATQNQNFVVLLDNAGDLLPAINAGCVGSTNGLSVILGEAVCQLHQLAVSKQYEKAQELQLKLVNLNYMLKMREYGVPGLKAAMDILGYYGGAPRKPLQPLKDADREKIKDCLKKSGLCNL